jgi:hypothetical protein
MSYTLIRLATYYVGLDAFHFRFAIKNMAKTQSGGDLNVSDTDLVVGFQT